MTIRYSQLKTHWTPDEAHSMIILLDELRDILWNHYGTEILEYYQEITSCSTQTPVQENTERLSEKKTIDWIDDEIPF